MNDVTRLPHTNFSPSTTAGMSHFTVGGFRKEFEHARDHVWYYSTTADLIVMLP